MDEKELNDFFKKMLQRQEAFFLELKNDVQQADERLEKLLFGQTSDLLSNTTDKTPQQSKKRTKRLSTVADIEETEFGISIKNETRTEEDSTYNDNTSRRPIRAAKLNLDFKEPPINKKCRRPSNFNENTFKKNIKVELNTTDKKNNKSIAKAVKKRQNSKESLLSKKKSEEPMEIDENPIKILDKTNDNEKRNTDESVVMIQRNSKSVIIEIQDSENENEMLPPQQTVPLKKNVRNKKQSKSSVEDATKTKFDNLSLLNETDKINGQIDSLLKDPILKIEKLSLELPAQISQQTDLSQQTDISQSVKSKNNKATGKKGKKVLPKPMKEERISLEIVEQNSNSKQLTSANDNAGSTSTVTTAIVPTEIVPASEKNISLDSVYEDAIPTNDNIQQPLTHQNSTEKNPTSSIKNNINELANAMTPEIHDSLKGLQIDKSPQIDDATFVSAKDVGYKIAASMANETFVTQSGLIAAQSTFIVTGENQNINNATMLINEPKYSNGQIIDGDITFNVPQTADVKINSNELKASRNPVNRASIMTEDESYIEIPIKYKPKPKSQLNRKELFNPCVQSPLKKKIEAFEKQAFNNNSPIPQRQTRTKTRAKQAKENSEPDQEKCEENVEIIKPKPIKEKLITPLIGRQIGRLLTPSQSTYITPGVVKKLPSTASKIIGIQKTLQSAVSSSSSRSRTPSQSRENSVEDLRRYGLKLQELTEERKKKRELKQLQAQQTRERKEKERADNYKKITEEREEKARRKAAEAEQKRQLDEINRQLKLQEEKREQQRKLERQKQLEREAAEVARREREVLENLKIQKAKDKMQMKYEQNKKQLQQKKLINNGPKYDFDMLNSDDSTDDEAAAKANRPPAPQWSTSSVRQILFERQKNVPTKIIDCFFSVQALTPDLRDIFPNIDSKYLKRNSSVIWKTPPRYSQLPKRN